MIRPLAILLGGLALAGGAYAQGDPEAGRAVAGMCQTCHGLDGYARMPVAPHIGGEPAAYLAAQLHAFKDGTRRNEMMSIVSAGLSDAQIADVSAWYAAHRAVAAMPEGEGPEACVDCHGADGIGLADDVPNLAGEPAPYLGQQLAAFRSGERVHEVMSEVAADLTDAEIAALADWYAGIELTIAPPE